MVSSPGWKYDARLSVCLIRTWIAGTSGTLRSGRPAVFSYRLDASGRTVVNRRRDGPGTIHFCACAVGRWSARLIAI